MYNEPILKLIDTVMRRNGMQDRQGDVLYSGVRQNVIENAKPELNVDTLNTLNEWIKDRYEVRLNKDVYKTPKPWTTNPVFLDVKFTNVRREHDRNTIWIIENICNDLDRPLRDRLLDCILCRMYNKWQTLDLIGVPFEWNGNYSSIRSILETKSVEDPNYVFYTSAFNTGGMKVSSGKLVDDPFIPMRPFAIMDYIIHNGIIDDIMNSATQEDVYNALTSAFGIGPFLGYQMFVDFTYCPDYMFSENHFTVAGPGCKLGLNKLFMDYDGMTHNEAIFWLRDNWNDIDGNLDITELMTDLPMSDRVMNVMSLENCFCELGKYIKCKAQIDDGKKPRARVSYAGNKEVEIVPTLFDFFT